jgi:hypothetical protein
VNEFVALVKENQETLNALKSCVNAQTVALLVDAVSVAGSIDFLLLKHPSVRSTSQMLLLSYILFSKITVVLLVFADSSK